MVATRWVVAAAVPSVLLAAAQAGAQATVGTVTGVVTDSASQQPLANVTVNVIGTTRGALTGPDGRFTIGAVPAGTYQLRAQRIGYSAQSRPVTVTANASVTVGFVLRAQAANLSAVVVTGYGTQRREAITGSVASVDANEADVGVVPNVNTMIQGRAAGVQITQNSGDPGAGAQIRVRGGASISANSEPLYVIDGVPIQNDAAVVPSLAPGAPAAGSPLPPPGGSGGGAQTRSPLNTINPDDIADITILKDASATAIYGSRAANGVILITTKKGQAGAAQVDYDGFVGFASQARYYDVLSASEFRGFYQQQVQAGTPGFTQAGFNGLGAANTDWQREVSRQSTIQNHNLAVAGGSALAQYRASLNYFDNPGIVVGSGLARVQGRVNAQSRLLNDKLTLNLNLTSAQTRDRYLTAENTGGFTGGVFINALTFLPTNPVLGTSVAGTPYFELGAGQQNQRNPLGLAEQITDRANTTRTLGNLQAQYTFLPGLTGSVNVGVDRQGSRRDTYIPSNSPLGAGYTAAGLAGLGRIGSVNLRNATVQTLVTYERDLTARQSLSVVAGYEQQRFSNSLYTFSGVGFVSDVPRTNNIGAASQLIQPFSNLANTVQEGVFARVNYGFADRYFLTAVVRRDGSSVFGENNRYATFPGVSASWRVSEESFAKGRLPFNDLKLRVNYGAQGNQAIQPYQSLALLGTNPNNRYPFGGTLVTGVLPIQNPNPDLRWETTIQAGAGVDFAFWDNRFTGSVDYWSKTTRDLLLLVPVPAPAVVPTQLQNVGKLRNAGWEGSLDYAAYRRAGRNVSFGLILTADRNRVVDLGGRQQIFTGTGSGSGQSATNSQIVRPGLPLGSFYGPVSAGVNAQRQEIFHTYDTNGNRTGTAVAGQLVPERDYQVLGNANPQFSLGFRNSTTWGRFTGSFLVRAVQGNEIFNNTAIVYASKSGATQGSNFIRSALNDGLDPTAANLFSSRFIEDGSFIRLQNVTLGYNLPVSRFIRRVNTMNVYVSADNLFLITDYSGLDPEVNAAAGANGIPSLGIDYLQFPRARTFTIGTRVGF